MKEDPRLKKELRLKTEHIMYLFLYLEPISTQSKKHKNL